MDNSKRPLYCLVYEGKAMSGVCDSIEDAAFSANSSNLNPVQVDIARIVGVKDNGAWILELIDREVWRQEHQ